MKTKSGFSLIEVIIGVTMLSLLIFGIVENYNYLRDRDLMIDDRLKSMYFNNYLFNLLNTITIPQLNEGSKFYLVSTSDNSFSISLDPISNKNNVGFFDGTQELDYNHSIEYIKKVEFKGVEFNIYKVYSYYNQNEKISYIIK